MFKNSRYCTIEEAAITLSVSTTEVNRVCREGKLDRKNKHGKSMISRKSLRKYRVNRHQRTAEWYISIKDAAAATGLSEYVIQSAIDRKELETKEYRKGLIITLKSFWFWVKALMDADIFPLKTKKVLEGSIKVKNRKGLHTRPCGLLYEICKKYFQENTKLILKVGEKEACGESLTDLLKLKASYGERLRYRIEGDLCEDLLVELKRLFNNFEDIDSENIENYKCDLKAVARDINMSSLGRIS